MAPRRSTTRCTPGRLTSFNSLTAKFTRSFRVPPSIHSLPVCQPSTVGGFISAWPMAEVATARFSRPGSGKLCEPASFTALTTSSTGLFTLRNRAALKDSELNSTRSMARRLPPESK